MESCPHVRQMRVCQHTALLNPRNWACSDCGTTDSVWACLTCSHFSCGRSSEGHAMKHYTSTKHPLAIEVNQKYVHCYLCNDWILNDTSTGDIQLIQSLLGQVAAQNYQESYTRSGRVLRPATMFTRMESKVEEAQSRTADKRYTALFHWKHLSLSKAFNSWRLFVKIQKEEKQKLVKNTSNTVVPQTSSYQSISRKKLITPGMTGLRNLGNTCYMNAALQALGHLHFLRETFRQMGQCDSNTSDPVSVSSLSRSDSGNSVMFSRQTTVECFQHISTKPVLPSGIRRLQSVTGLSGGSGGRTRSMVTSVSEEELGSLCEEIHGLMRVMWSGKWAVVTPHTVLTAIWHHIPTFRGYCQQDAQEFLCELLDRLHSELLQCPSEVTINISHPSRDIVAAREIIPSLFQGTLSSTITYSKCGHQSITREPFWDLSLEFPDRYQSISTNTSNTQSTTGRRSSHIPCNLKDILNLFTSVEDLEDEIYTCDHCPTFKQTATKQFSIVNPPEVLRLHLKRFRFCGRTWQKITSHVIFPMEMNLQSFCTTPTNIAMETDGVGVITDLNIFESTNDLVYDLASVIVHHGAGFSCGHYTAYCWNNEAASWIHCNDTRLSRCLPEDVLNSQAYVLFYSRRTGRSPVLNRLNYTTNDTERTISTFKHSRIDNSTNNVDEILPSSKRRKRI